MGVLISDRTARAMYAGHRGDPRARRFARFWAWLAAWGLLPRRWVALEVPGRRSGRLTRFPLGMADVDGRWYLVSMLGPDCNWVHNVRAAGGRVTIRRRRRFACQLTEVPVAERAPILRRYLRKAPGARPHIPVDRRATPAEFAAVAADYPVFGVSFIDRSGHERPALGPYRRRRWGRRLLLGGAAAIALVLVAAVAVGPQPGPPPFTLPAPAAPAAGSLDGTWTAGPGSTAGFRLRQTSLGRSSDVVGRTTAVTGTATVARGRLTAATFRVDLGSVTVNGKPQPQFARSLETARYPAAEFTATAAVPTGAGAIRTTSVPGRLTLHGTTRAVSLTVTGQLNGSTLQVVGSTPIEFADWGIAGPRNYGPLGSLDRHGVAEFLLTLRRS